MKIEANILGGRFWVTLKTVRNYKPADINGKGPSSVLSRNLVSSNITQIIQNYEVHRTLITNTIRNILWLIYNRVLIIP